MDPHDKGRRAHCAARCCARAWPAGGAALAGPALAASGRAPADPANLPPNVAGLDAHLGDGVAVRPTASPPSSRSTSSAATCRMAHGVAASSVSFTPLHELDGIITPNGLCFERHHAGIAEVDPADYRLMMHGLVDKPLIFTLDDLKRMPRVNRAYFCECAANSGMEWRGAQLNGCQFTHGMVHCVMYTGVPLKVLLDEAGLKPNAKWLLLEGGDAAAMTRSLPLAKALDDCLVAYRMNGEMLLSRERLSGAHRVPGWEGNMWVKWLRRIEVGDQPWHHARGDVEIHRPAGGRQGAPLHLRHGRQVRHHQARARRRRSTTRGHRAVRPRLVGPRQDRARRRVARRRPQLARPPSSTARSGTRPDALLLRVRLGRRELLLQSRAMDETGYVQPTKDELRKVRGVNSIYHNNGIQTWLLHERRGRECRSLLRPRWPGCLVGFAAGA
jgi:sulfane dehydrogenase subunit SoxC